MVMGQTALAPWENVHGAESVLYRSHLENVCRHVMIVENTEMLVNFS